MARQSACGRIETAWCPENCRDFREKPPCDGRPVCWFGRRGLRLFPQRGGPGLMDAGHS